VADTESLDETGVAFLERLAAMPGADRRVRIPTITDPRGADFSAATRLKQQDWMGRAGTPRQQFVRGIGLLMTNTCMLATDACLGAACSGRIL
jgi:predicted aconitase